MSSFTRMAIAWALVLLHGGCEAPPAIEIGPLSFPEEALRGLSEAQESMLIRIASLGLAVAHDELDRLGAPFMEEGRRGRMIERLRAEVALEEAGVDDAVLEARYATSPDWELEVRHLVRLADPRDDPARRAAQHGVAVEARTRVLSGEPFAEVAGELSEEPGADRRGGLLDPGREGTWVQDFWNAALALDPGEVSGVVETPYGYHVLKLESRRPIPFPEVRPTVAMEVATLIDDGAAWEAWVESAVGLDAGGSEANASLAALAVQRGISLTPADEAEIERRWERAISPIALTFGFESGLAPEEIRTRSLQALGATQQSARVARADLQALAPLIDGAYPVVDHR